MDGEDEVVTEGVDGGGMEKSKEVRNIMADAAGDPAAGASDTAGLVDGWHNICSQEHILYGSSLECEAHMDSRFIGLISPM